MKKKYTLIVITIALHLHNGALNAQDQKSAADSTLPKKESAFSRLPSISGFVNLRYQYSTEAQNYSNGRNGFDVRRAYFEVKGKATATIGYRLMVDFAGSPRILDAFADWKPLKNISIQAGQFKIPFSLENPYSPLTLEAIDNAAVITSLVTDISGNKNNGRDIGVQLAGSFFNKGAYNLIDYKAGVFNGNKINSADDNKTKDVVATLSVNPFRQFRLNGSYYDGAFGPEATKVNRQRWGAGIKYEDSRVLVRSEYISGITDHTRQAGYYVTGAVFVTRRIQPVVRFDSYSQDTSDSYAAADQYLVGANYFITDNSRVQINFTHKNNADPSKKDYDLLSTQVIIAF